jgi:hypothetical protein
VDTIVTLRATIIALIMSTDLGFHFQHIKTLGAVDVSVVSVSAGDRCHWRLSCFENNN